jgi:homoserine dehydrogenase
MRIALLLIGFGHVGRRFVHLVHEMTPTLEALGIAPVVVGICTRRHGVQ